MTDKRALDEGLDPDVRAALGRLLHVETDGATIRRNQELVSTRLRTHSSRRRSGGRVFAGAVGGGGLWAAFAATAAAHKAVAATAIGLGVLAGGTFVAQTTELGTTVRETLGVSNSHEEPQADPSITQASEDLPGNFVTQLHEGGAFTLRGELVAVEAQTFTVRSADGDLTFEIGAAEIRIPGQDTLLSDHTGALVFLMGNCDGSALTADCVVDRISVLGRAGQTTPDSTSDRGGPPNPATTGSPSEGRGQSDDRGRGTTNTGKPTATATTASD